MALWAGKDVLEGRFSEARTHTTNTSTGFKGKLIIPTAENSDVFMPKLSSTL